MNPVGQRLPMQVDPQEERGLESPPLVRYPPGAAPAPPPHTLPPSLDRRAVPLEPGRQPESARRLFGGNQ